MVSKDDTQVFFVIILIFVGISLINYNCKKDVAKVDPMTPWLKNPSINNFTEKGIRQKLKRCTATGNPDGRQCAVRPQSSNRPENNPAGSNKYMKSGRGRGHGGSARTPHGKSENKHHAAQAGFATLEGVTDMGGDSVDLPLREAGWDLGEPTRLEINGPQGTNYLRQPVANPTGYVGPFNNSTISAHPYSRGLCSSGASS